MSLRPNEINNISPPLFRCMPKLFGSWNNRSTCCTVGTVDSIKLSVLPTCTCRSKNNSFVFFRWRKATYCVLSFLLVVGVKWQYFHWIMLCMFFPNLNAAIVLTYSRGSLKGWGGGGMCVIKSEYENPLFHILRRKSRPRIGIRVASVLMFMSSWLSQYQSILESFVPISLLLSRGFKAMWAAGIFPTSPPRRL